MFENFNFDEKLIIKLVQIGLSNVVQIGLSNVWLINKDKKEEI